MHIKERNGFADCTINNVEVTVMNSNETNSEIGFEQDLSGIVKRNVIPTPAIPRRTFLAAGTAVGASVLLGLMAGAASLAGVASPALKESDVATSGITLHVTEQGDGPAVLFCHGFPDTSYTWRRQMKAVASAGYRAIAPDMRGYGRSLAPADAKLYTPLHTAGDLVGLLDALDVS